MLHALVLTHTGHRLGVDPRVSQNIRTEKCQTGSRVGITADLVGVEYSAPFECGLTVTNNGPGIARGARIIQVSVPLGIPTSFRYLGDLAPGESRTEKQVDCGIYGRLSMYAVSLTPDLNPGNNGGQVFPS